MHALLPLFLIAVGSDTPIESRYPEAIEIFRCAFDQSWDENFDGWPDRWTRRRGPGFPYYVGIELHEASAPVGNRCLRIELDGGGAVAYSPAINVGPLFSYVLEGYIKTEGLTHDRAYFSLTLLNAQRHRLETIIGDKVRQTDGWKKFRLGPITPASHDTCFAIVGLHVQPQAQEDLKGTAMFGDVWVGRLPRMDLGTNDAYNFFTDEQTIEVSCRVSGFIDEQPEISFRLEDVLGRKLAEYQCRIDTKAAQRAGESSPEGPSVKSRDSLALVGAARWKPPVPGPGFYRVYATMKGRTRAVFRRGLNLVVIEPRFSSPGGEFGWTLPSGDQPMPLPPLGKIVVQAGINWVKYPLWHPDENGDEFIEQLVAFGERIGAHGIRLVGLLCNPPPSLRQRYGQAESLLVSQLFEPDPKIWYPSIEPVMMRMATRVRWWQLGADTDISFVGYPDAYEMVRRVKAELDRIGQDVSLSIGWGWINALPPTFEEGAPWRCVTLSADPPMTHRELATYLDASGETALQRWVVIEPLSKDDYSAEVRATDLVRRMIAAKIHGAEAIFCPQPFSTRRGLMNDDGTPGELFLPWRTAALALGGATYLGSIQLPGGSPNQVFVRENDAVMVVWNDTPTEEVLYLGENVRQIDLWGRGNEPARREHRQVISAGRLPTFVTGINEPITRWRLGFAFTSQRLPSIFGRPHQNSLRVKNHFDRGTTGKATLVMPEIWRVEPEEVRFRLAEGEELERPFEITFPYDASSGRNKVRVDFDVQADRPYRFSVYRNIDVGLGSVHFEMSTRLNARGELEVEQRFVNASDDAVSFRCQLFAPGRQRLKTQILGLGGGSDVKTYHLPNGAELLGKALWLRAQEMDGPRILNYRFEAER